MALLELSLLVGENVCLSHLIELGHVLVDNDFIFWTVLWVCLIYNGSCMRNLRRKPVKKTRAKKMDTVHDEPESGLTTKRVFQQLAFQINSSFDTDLAVQINGKVAQHMDILKEKQAHRRAIKRNTYTWFIRKIGSTAQINYLLLRGREIPLDSWAPILCMAHLWV